MPHSITRFFVEGMIELAEMRDKHEKQRYQPINNFRYRIRANKAIGSRIFNVTSHDNLQFSKCYTGRLFRISVQHILRIYLINNLSDNKSFLMHGQTP